MWPPTWKGRQRKKYDDYNNQSQSRKGRQVDLHSMPDESQIKSKRKRRKRRKRSKGLASVRESSAKLELEGEEQGQSYLVMKRVKNGVERRWMLLCTSSLRLATLAHNHRTRTTSIVDHSTEREWWSKFAVNGKRKAIEKTSSTIRIAFFGHWSYENGHQSKMRIRFCWIFFHASGKLHTNRWLCAPFSTPAPGTWTKLADWFAALCKKRPPPIQKPQ